MVQQVVIVHPDRACAEAIAHVDSGIEVAGVQGGGEAVGALVADADGVVHGLEFGDGADGAEDFFLHDLHVLGHVAEDGRLDEVPFGPVALAASFDFGAGFFAFVDVAMNIVSDLRVLCLAFGFGKRLTP